MPIVDVTIETPLAFDFSVFTHLRNRQPYVLENLKKYFSHHKIVPVLPAMTVFEAKWGNEKDFAQKKITIEVYEKYVKEIDNLTEIHPILPFDQKEAEISAYIYTRLSQSDRNKHWADVFIISTVLANNFGLITQNVKDAKLIAEVLPSGYQFLSLAVWKP
jgi:predicted nucleic acid-binding protein